MIDKNVLLVGGYTSVKNGLVRRIQNENVALRIYDHWAANRGTSSYKDIPKKVDFVVLISTFCDHSTMHNIQAATKKANVPLVISGHAWSSLAPRLEEKGLLQKRDKIGTLGQLLAAKGVSVNDIIKPTEVLVSPSLPEADPKAIRDAFVLAELQRDPQQINYRICKAVLAKFNYYLQPRDLDALRVTHGFPLVKSERHVQQNIRSQEKRMKKTAKPPVHHAGAPTGSLPGEFQSALELLKEAMFATGIHEMQIKFINGKLTCSYKQVQVINGETTI